MNIRYCKINKKENDMKEIIEKLESGKSRKVIIGILILILALQVVARVYFGCKKQYFHMDEMYSYGLMNYHNLNITDNHDFLNQWHTKEYYQDYLTVNSDEVWDLTPVYENQKNDVHPPVYYLLLRIASTFTINNFSKWTGITLNILLFIFSSILVYLISNRLFHSKVIALIICAFNGFTFMALESTLYIRMYELANLNILLLTYTQLLILDKKQLKFVNCIPIIIALLLGGLTHYYFFIYAAATYIMYVVKCMKEKSYRNLGIYTGAMIVAAIIFLAIFPHAINHVLFGYRGLNGGDGTGYVIKIAAFLNIIVQNLSGYFLVFIPVILYIMTKNREKKYTENKSSNDNIDWLLLPLIAYFFVVAKNAPYLEIRYMIPIGSALTISIIYFIWKFLKQYYIKKHVAIILIIFCTIMIASPFITGNKLSFTYSQFNHIADVIEEKQLPIIYIFDTSRNRFLDDLYLFTLTDKAIVIDSKELDKFEGEIQSQEQYILICNNEEISKEFLKGKNATYIQRMNACDIWQITK